MEANRGMVWIVFGIAHPITPLQSLFEFLTKQTNDSSTTAKSCAIILLLSEALGLKKSFKLTSLNI